MLQPPLFPHHIGAKSLGMGELLVFFAMVIAVWGFYRLR
jgi:hypothetical protein